MRANENYYFIFSIFENRISIVEEIDVKVFLFVSTLGASEKIGWSLFILRIAAISSRKCEGSGILNVGNF